MRWCVCLIRSTGRVSHQAAVSPRPGSRCACQFGSPHLWCRRMNRDRSKYLLELTGKWKAGSKLATHAYIYCPGYESPGFQTQACNRAIWGFCQNSGRALHFARTSLHGVHECLSERYLAVVGGFIPIDDAPALYPGNVPVGDEVVFGFDAFAMCSKVLFEKKVLSSLDRLHPESARRVRTAHRRHFGVYMSSPHRQLRNDIVHVNQAGSGGRFMGAIRETPAGPDLSVPYRERGDAAGPDLDLLELLSGLIEILVPYVSEVLGAILGHYYRLLGRPEHDEGFSSEDCVVRLSDYPLP